MPPANRSEREAARLIVRKYDAAVKANPNIEHGSLAAAMLPPVRDKHTRELRPRTNTSAAAQMRVYRQIASGKISRKASPTIEKAQSGAAYGSGLQVALKDTKGNIRSFQVRLPKGSSTLDLFTPRGKRKLRAIAKEYIDATDKRYPEAKLESIIGARIVHIGTPHPYVVQL